jgi:dolichyl-diphosphooligosaccharide--protein glycosyltransferase
MIHRVSVRRVLIATGWAAVVAGALSIRILPAWQVVFGPQGVNFQSSDALYHVRAIHNLLAHLPRRSGFDPYALFPGGQNVPTGPLWDYLVAVTAWIASAGAPSPKFVDAVAAWLPAILGALFVLPAYFMARRIFGKTAAAFAVLWMGSVPGAFLWLTHLGVADHHAAEGWFAFLTLACLSAAIETPHGPGVLRSALAGIALGAFLATRPAGIFVPAILAVVAVWQPAVARPVLAAVCIGASIFIPVTGNQWSKYTWLALAGTIAVAGASVASSILSRQRFRPQAVDRLASLAALAAALFIANIAWPRLLVSLWFEIRRVAGVMPASKMVAAVQELRPIFHFSDVPGWLPVFQQLGAVWIPALPALAWVVWHMFRARRPALTLFAVWCLVITIGTLIQARMAIYFAPVASVLAGAACARITDFVRPALRRYATAALVAVVAAINLVPAVYLVRSDNSTDADWRAALLWLRNNSPEPFSQAAVWSNYYPRLASRAAPADSPAWGVAVWWDRGYDVEALAHRVPMANGTQSGAENMARFFTETNAESAVRWLRQAGARYVIVDPPMAFFAGQNQSRFPTAVGLAGRDLNRYFRVLIQDTVDGPRALPVYLPEYYRTMAARLFLFDGAETAGTGPWLFETQPVRSGAGTLVEAIAWAQHFASEPEAAAYMKARPFARFTLGCVDPGVSCFALPAVNGLRRAFSSDPLPLSPDRTVRAVKIFEVIQP